MKEYHKREKIWSIGICLLIIFGINILFNYWISAGPRAFYFDDLDAINTMKNESGIISYAFRQGANKLRPIAQGVMYIAYMLSGNNYEIIDEFLLLLNYFNAILVFGFLFSLLKNRKWGSRVSLSLMCSILFLSSRFAYYNISELFGIMESLGITFALGMLLLLLQYIERKQIKYFYWAVILYGLLIYTHERYIVLIVMFPLALIFMGKASLKKNYVHIILPVFLFLSFWIVRWGLFGNRALDGTGGTSVTDTFNILEVIEFAFSQVGYLLGWNCGPGYLNGINALQVPWKINILLIFITIFYLSVLVILIKTLITNPEFRKKHLKIMALFVVFIGCCIVSSSITIRVEMRWIYVSYAAFLLFIFYTISILDDCYHFKIPYALIFMTYICCLLFVEQYYRGHYDGLYYWTEKDMSRELYEVTVEKYGAELENKHIYILSDDKYQKSWGDEQWKFFFSPYVNSENIEVEYIDSIYEAEHIGDDCILLLEDVENQKYIEINQDVLEPITYGNGIYEDGWIEQECTFSVNKQSVSKIIISLYYPEELTGNEKGQIFVNGEYARDYQLIGGVTDVEIELPQGMSNQIEIISDYFCYDNTGRSEKGTLSCVLIDVKME